MNHYAYSDAVFLAERLYAEGKQTRFDVFILILIFIAIFAVETDDSLFLLATSYYRWGKPHHAYSILKDKPGTTLHPQCRFLLAKCATDLNR